MSANGAKPRAAVGRHRPAARIAFLSLLLFLWSLWSGKPAYPLENKLFFSESAPGTIQRVDFDGANETCVAQGLTTPRGVAVDDPNDFVYWADAGTGKIQRVDLTNVCPGASPTDIVTGLTTPVAVDLDLTNNKAYWVDQGTQKVQNADLSGAFPAAANDVITTDLLQPAGIAVGGSKIYWTDSALGKIERADLNGTNRETLLTGLSNPVGIEVDTTNGKIYWTDTIDAKIRRTDLDGSNQEVVITLVTGDPLELTINLDWGFFHWTDPSLDQLRRATLDGQNVQVLLSGLSDPWGLGLLGGPSPTPTFTNTFTPTNTPTLTPTITPTPTLTPTITQTLTPTITPTATNSLSPTPTFTPTASPTSIPPLCPAFPAQGCRTPLVSAAAHLILRQHSDPLRNRLVWRWARGAPTSAEDLGNPVSGTTHYELCLYDESGGTPALVMSALAPASSLCPKNRPCWSGSAGRFKYLDRNMTPEGLLRILLVAGDAGRAKIIVKGKGASLPLPSLPLNQASAVTVQLINQDGTCFEARYSAPAISNTGAEFKDSSE